MIQDLIVRLGQGTELTPVEIKAAVGFLVSESEPVEKKAEFLEALARKGETPAEIEGFVNEMRRLSIPVEIPAEIRESGLLDVVGTGGDHAGTINISTASALLCAAAGVRVCKHGNRAATSRCGSADVLEALGVKIDISPEQICEWLVKYGFAFIFAPRYHPAFKHVAPARKICAQRGVRTIFNYLGPLLNPAKPNMMLVGVTNPELCFPIAQVLSRIGVKRGMVVCSKVVRAGHSVCLDELCTFGGNVVAEFGENVSVNLREVMFSSYGATDDKIEAIRGGDPQTNARIIEEVLCGRDTGTRSEVVCLNAGAALVVAGKANDIIEGMRIARELIASGAAKEKLTQLRLASRE